MLTYVVDRLVSDIGDVTSQCPGRHPPGPRLRPFDRQPALVRLDHRFLGDVGSHRQPGTLPPQPHDQFGDEFAVEGTEGRDVGRLGRAVVGV